MLPNNPGLTSELALWGGIECTHVLIRGCVRDQLQENGHFAREDDLERVADLGIRTLRYPLLWAHAARGGGYDFEAHADRFDRLQRLGIQPIVGFLHHGSGPGGLHPEQPDFVDAFARYAGAAAARFPDIMLYTPINEPVTTARFSYLYGHWHPHAWDERAFFRAVVGSVEATAAAMRAIRSVNPRAGLVQTEDLGRIFATPPLEEQAAYENERRFLGFDLLTGRVRRDHPFWSRLQEAGVAASRLDALAAEPCPPSIIGLDYYLTSDRFLDHRPERHPHEPIGGNGRQRYVDVAAAQLPEIRPLLGMGPRLREIHARCGLPMAVTEVHNGCTREEQLRWLLRAWQEARALRAEGLPVEAVTIWSLFGTVDWNSLLVARRGHYESGAFDTRTSPPRATVLARAAAALAAGRPFDHPVLARPGWWQDEVDEPPEALPLELRGPPEALDMLAARCELRRITTTRRRERTSWGQLAVEPTSAHHRFAFRSNGRSLRVEAPNSANFAHAADAALDLALDGETGDVRIDDVGPASQFRFVRHVPGG